MFARLFEFVSVTFKYYVEKNVALFTIYVLFKSTNHLRCLLTWTYRLLMRPNFKCADLFIASKTAIYFT
jgi:hypothetical protein